MTEEREFLRSLNETLLSNQKDFNSKLATAQADLAAKDAQMQDLQEQVGGELVPHAMINALRLNLVPPCVHPFMLALAMARLFVQLVAQAVPLSLSSTSF